MSCLLVSLIKCFKSHKYLGSLFEGVLQMSFSLSLSLSLPLSLSLYFCWSGHVSSSLPSHVSRVTRVSECCMVVFFQQCPVVRDKVTYRAVWGQLKNTCKTQLWSNAIYLLHIVSSSVLIVHQGRLCAIAMSIIYGQLCLSIHNIEICEPQGVQSIPPFWLINRSKLSTDLRLLIGQVAFSNGHTQYHSNVLIGLIDNLPCFVTNWNWTQFTRSWC